MAEPVTQLAALVDVSQTDAGWVVTTTITDRSGAEVHKRIGDPIKDEEIAYEAVGAQRYMLERVGIPAEFTKAATELLIWWQTDRFTLAYHRFFAKHEDSFPTLEQAFRAAEGMIDYETGVPEEITEAGSGRSLYRNTTEGWERLAHDMPAIEEFQGVVDIRI